MDYARFVRTREAAWEAFARGLDGAHDRRRTGYADLERLAFGYREVLHDHAVAAARFPGTAAARRLWRLALEGTQRLHADGGERVASLSRFFGQTFPRAFRSHLPHIGVAVLLLGGAGLMGLSLALVQPALGTTLLGPEAVRGLEQGRLWTESLTTTVPPALSSSAIATNNMSVALTAWAGGALAGLGALYVLLLNGFLLGSVVGVTARYGMEGELLEFVAAHGPLEITLILCTAAAGLGLGRGLVQAGDRPRADALREAAGSALALLLGCLPWFVVLGLVEGFISPSPTVAAGLKSTLGASLLGLFLLVAWQPWTRR